MSYHVSQECIASNVEWHAKTLGENNTTKSTNTKTVSMFNGHGSMGVVCQVQLNGCGSKGMA